MRNPSDSSDRHHTIVTPARAAILAAAIIGGGLLMGQEGEPDRPQNIPELCQPGQLVGDEVVLPTLEISGDHTEPGEAMQTETIANNKPTFFTIKHQVKPGESLSAISRCFFEDEAQGMMSLIAANPNVAENPDIIQPGQTIFVSINAAKTLELTAGITVQDLATKLGVEPNLLAKLNNADVDAKLDKGVTVILPRQRQIVSQDGEELRTIQAGDTYYGLSKEYGTSVAELLTTNGIPPEELRPGHIFRVPDKPDTLTEVPGPEQATDELGEETDETIAPPQGSVAERIAAVELTPEGFERFKASINTEHMEYAQQYQEFNPSLNSTEQGISSMFIFHYTTFYVNEDGASSEPQGKASVKRFIDAMHNQDGPNCCGVQWFIDRDGVVHQLAPIDAKLKHNPPFDSVSTGAEVEADKQESITTEQYESLAYLGLHVLIEQGLLGKASLKDLALGHGEMRTRWNKENPNNPLAVRTDFLDAEASAVREKQAVLAVKLGYQV